jgi:chromosomal replication initiation ATPase DnaA
MRIQIKKKQHFVSPYVYAGLPEEGVISQLQIQQDDEVMQITKDSILEVACSICNKFNDTQYLPEDVKGRNRQGELVEIRHMATYFMRELLDAKWSVIGWHLGGRDHSTAINSYRKWADRTSLPFEKKTHKMNDAMYRAFGISK